MIVTFSAGGTKEFKVDLERLKIPDLWAIAMSQRNASHRDAILACWHMAHDLKKTLLDLEEKSKAL